jgi:hypothetical protein
MATWIYVGYVGGRAVPLFTFSLFLSQQTKDTSDKMRIYCPSFLSPNYFVEFLGSSINSRTPFMFLTFYSRTRSPYFSTN